MAFFFVKPTIPKHSNYRPDVDGLRAVAIIPVVAFHAGLPMFGGGFVGVDVFFVISGFLITQLLWDELHQKDHIKFFNFYARRARRLFPALTVVSLATLLLGFWFLLPFGEQQELAKSSISTSLFSSNIYFWTLSGYFDGPAELKPLLNMWTLSVEEQFYWVWPILLLGTWRLSNNLKVSRRQQIWLTLFVLILIVIVSLWSSVWLTSHSQATAFYMTPVRAWEFALGGIVAILPSPTLDSRTLRAHAISALGLAGLGMIIWSVTTYSRATSFPGAAAIVPALGAALVIFSGSLSRSFSYAVLALPGLVATGLLSYSWYLWHWPLMAIARAYFYGEPNLLRDTLLAFAGLGLALLTYRFVENPIRHARKGMFSSTRGALGAGLGLLAAIALCGAGMGLHAKSVVRSSRLEKSLLAAGRDHKIFCPECMDELESGAFQGTLPSIKKCSFGGAEPRILLWGDSFLEQYAPLLDRLGRKYSLGLVQRLMGGCAPTLGIIPLKGGIPNMGCAEFNTQVRTEMASLRDLGIDSIILSSDWLMQDPSPGEVEPEIVHEAIAHFAEGLRKTLDELGIYGFRVLLIAPSPEFPISVPMCLGRRPADRCGISRNEFEARREKILNIMYAQVHGRPNVRIFDPVPSLCNQTYCPPIIQGVIAYRDRGHLAASVLDEFEGNLDPFIRWLAGQEESISLTISDFNEEGGHGLFEERKSQPRF